MADRSKNSKTTTTDDPPAAEERPTGATGWCPQSPEKTERRNEMKVRLSKQVGVEVAEDDIGDDVRLVMSKRHELTADVALTRHDPPLAADDYKIPLNLTEATVDSSLKSDETDADNSPNSDSSDQTVVPAESIASSATPHGSPKDISPEDGTPQLEGQKTSDLEKAGSPTQAINAKVKLVRSQAVYDNPSPPPPEILIRSSMASDGTGAGISSRELLLQDMTTSSSNNLSTLSVSPTFQLRGVAGRHKLVHGGSQGSTVSDSGTSPALSRDSSFETAYTDSTGTNLEEFFIKTLNRKAADRTMLLNLELDMTAFVNDKTRERQRFPPMSTYHRMLVHRVAAFFGLDHNIDETGKSVVVSRLECARIPEFQFANHIQVELPSDDQPKKSILRRHRDYTSLEEMQNRDRICINDRKSKSFEEREEEYHEARNRIFQESTDLNDVVGQTSANRPSDLYVTHGSGGGGKDEVTWYRDHRPWSSTDSSGYSTDGSSRLRVYVTKASSFHSVSVLSRGDSRTSSGSGWSRTSKTDSIGSGISNLGSPMIIPPTIPSSPPPEMEEYETCNVEASTMSQDGMQSDTSSPFPLTLETGEPLAIWVASTINQIPSGSIIINPQTGQPYINADGTVYRWYPPSEWTSESDGEERQQQQQQHGYGSFIAASISPGSLSPASAAASHSHPSLDLEGSPSLNSSTISIPSQSLEKQNFSVKSFPPDVDEGKRRVISPQQQQQQQQQQLLHGPCLMATAPGYPAASLVPAGNQEAPFQQIYMVAPQHQAPQQFYPGPPPTRYAYQTPRDDKEMIGQSFVTGYPPPPSDLQMADVYPAAHQQGFYTQAYVAPQFSGTVERENQLSEYNPSISPPQIFYLPSSGQMMATDGGGGGAVMQSALMNNQGQIQLVRVNTASNVPPPQQTAVCGNLFYPRQPCGMAGGPQMQSTGGQVPQYVCYSFPIDISSQPCASSLPVMPSYSSISKLPPGSYVLPNVPSRPRSRAPVLKSSSSSSHHQTHIAAAAAYQVKTTHLANQQMEPNRSAILRHLPPQQQQRLPGTRPMLMRQPQIVLSYRAPHTHSVGERLSLSDNARPRLSASALNTNGNNTQHATAQQDPLLPEKLD